MFKKTVFILLLSFFVSLQITGSIFAKQEKEPRPNTPNKRSMNFYQKGCAFENIGALAQAEDAYKKAIEAEPKFNAAIFRLACLYDIKGDYKQSKPLYERILQNNKGFYFAYNNLAIIEFSSGNEQQAINHWKESLKYDPSQIEVYNNLGLAYLRAEELEEALKCFDAALKIKPSYMGAANNRAFTLQKLALYKEANSQFDKNTKLFSYEPLVFYNYANFCLTYHNYPRAKELLNLAIKFRNNVSTFYSALAVVDANLGDFDEAMQNLAKATELDSKPFEYNRDSAIVYQKKGDIQQALLFYNKAMEVNPRDSLTVAGLGEIYIILKSPEKALELWQTHLSSKEDFLVRNARAKYYISSANYSAARSDLAYVLGKAPHEFNSLYLMGNLCSAEKNYSQAISYYEKTAESCPYFAEAANSAAMIYCEQGDLRKASEIISKSIESVPSYADSYSNLGVVYSKLGNDTMAVTTWMQGLTVNGSYAPIYYHLGVNSEKAGHTDDAVRYYQTYVRFDPDGKYAGDVRNRMRRLLEH